MKTEREPKGLSWLGWLWRRKSGPSKAAFAPARPMREIERSILRKLSARMREESCWSA